MGDLSGLDAFLGSTFVLLSWGCSPTFQDSTCQSIVIGTAIVLLGDWLLLKTVQQHRVAGSEALLLSCCRLTCVCIVWSLSRGNMLDEVSLLRCMNCRASRYSVCAFSAFACWDATGMGVL